MTRTQWLILIVAFSVFVIWRFFAACVMLQFAIKRGNAAGKRFYYFIMCFLLGLPAYLYIISLPDWKVRYDLNKIVWLLERNAPEKQAPAGECFVCKRKRKDMKYCRIIHNGTHKDVEVCTDCINVFVNCNPDSVFDLNSLETK